MKLFIILVVLLFLVSDCRSGYNSDRKIKNKYSKKYQKPKSS